MQSNRTEAQLQKAVVDYIKLQYPNIRYCASLGGQYQKFASQRKKAKDTGYIPGFPDLQITEPNSKFHGLFIEIKLDKKCYPSQYQKDWIKDLNTRGYYAKVCKGFDECIDTIDIYLKH
tara:strand:+ start:912 stop:1268 length:357 start_codon:yes stop_codon:yes gene_type:complete